MSHTFCRKSQKNGAVNHLTGSEVIPIDWVVRVCELFHFNRSEFLFIVDGTYATLLDALSTHQKYGHEEHTGQLGHD